MSRERGGALVIWKCHLTMWFPQHAFACTHTLPTAWNPSSHSLICHLKGPSSEKHSLSLQGRAKLQELIPRKLWSHSTSYVPLSHLLPHCPEQLCSRAYKQGSCLICLCPSAVCHGTWHQQICNKWQVSEWVNEQTREEWTKLHEGRSATNDNSLLDISEIWNSTWLQVINPFIVCRAG